MNRHIATFAACGLFGLGVPSAHASTDDASPERLAQGPSVRVFDGGTAPAPIGPQTMVFVDHMMGGERVVKGAPYCADAVNESIQTLADGNRIVRTNSTRQCRDGEGRTRQEVTSGGRTRVFLRDPVAQKHWVLDLDRKVATELGGARQRDAAEKSVQRVRIVRTPASGASSPAGEEVTFVAPVRMSVEENGRMHITAHGAARPQPSPSPAPAPTPVPSPMPGHGVVPPIPPLPPLPPAVGWLSDRLAPRGAGVVTALGSKEIDGVKVNGERQAWTIEAGRIGNEKPIVTTREVWTSPDLLLTVQSRDLDPRSGEQVYRLANLKRGEPDPALMKPPADFKPR